MVTLCGTIAAALILFYLGHVNPYITYIEVKYPLKGERSAPGSPWPLPQIWEPGKVQLTMDPNYFEIRSSEHFRCDIIKKAMLRYRGIIFDDILGRSSNLHGMLDELLISVEDTSCGHPKLGDDESYNLTIPAAGGKLGTLNAPTVWGVLRGLETFSQLVQIRPGDHTYLINATAIEDWPQYKYRGILIDSARHFQPVKTIKDILDSMAYNKFNVFHWHLIDDQSFPFQSKIYPNLTRLGAYSPKHVYSQKDVKNIIEAARLRGIRVIPEIDTPGHTQSIGKAFPHLLTTCYADGKPFQAVPSKHARAEILDPTKKATYDFFKRLFQEIRSVFVDDYIHLGMDEVYYDCWMSNPDIADFMEANGMGTNYSMLETYYVKKTLENVKKIGYKYMIWQDPVDNGVEPDKDTIIQVWKDTELVSSFKPWQENILELAKHGNQMVLSACWYLNYISYGEDWKKYYKCDPKSFEGSDSEKDLMIGGEACMWSEFVDGTNILSRLWPRASAVAERLWSDPDQTEDPKDAQYRLDEHRCRMLRRGIPAQPILNGFCAFEWDLSNSSIRLVINAPLFMLLLALIWVH